MIEPLVLLAEDDEDVRALAERVRALLADRDG
jgi:hypothetical protein